MLRGIFFIPAAYTVFTGWFMGFSDSITECFRGGELPAEPVFRAVMIGDYALYLEGVRSIKSYSAEKTELRLKKGGVTVAVEGLVIKKYCAGDVAICGKIVSVTRT